ncbi:preprotein translocase subunit SecA [Planctomycetes bacterium Pan216]|uniref:Protein translocase subunit SecA n=1 Tax=Kolteria novifilia TaxID=2527975 RepID=A0A518AX96_9BACT|nr:preprotein translocase subunit SecA [Planctomycetes bacterium Pan216]
MPLDLDDEYVYRSYLSTFRNVSAWQSVKMAQYRRQVAEVLDATENLANVSDAELQRLAAGYHQEAVNGRALDSLLVPVYALVRETSWRLLRMKHFPVQVLGGIALHHGHVIEASTGEGKTLLATLPSFLNALTDRGVHVVTVNDYLAKRDAEEMGRIHRFLGLTVGCIITDTKPQERQLAYRASITYATNKDLGFDFLRDQLRGKSNNWFSFGKRLDDLRVQKVQRPDFHYCIIDEADSILIDEARTPLIIANAPPVDEETAEEFMAADAVAAELVEDIDYTFDRKEKKIEWLRAGEQRLTRLLGGKRSKSGHRIDWHESTLRALKARVIFHRDVDYVVENGEVVIVDENTGRKMPGRQWEEGLHQAVSAKEKLEIKGETETLARTTYQIFFNRYEKLAGMSGTVMTDALEVAQVYDLPALKVPTNKPCIRAQLPDMVFGSEKAKFAAITQSTKEMVEKGRAVLIGTRSIEKSELLSRFFHDAGIEHVILNARFEEQEAAIVSQAGQPKRVTVATNMAGRGTDIKLHPDVAAAGGLHVIGTERHESRRVDNQLVGRAGRQGDPGSAQFFVSIEDPLIRRFRPGASRRLTDRYSEQETPIAGGGIRRFFVRVQLSIERMHRKIRYQLIKYDRERVKYNRQLGTE